MKITLITGSASGLGFEFAKLYAKDNNNLLLVDINEDKLNKAKEELTNLYNVSVETLVAEANDTIEVLISLENTTPYAAFQMDLHLPKGLSIVPQSLVLGERATGSHRMKSSPLRKNVMRVVSYSAPAENFTGNSGCLIKMNVVPNDEFSGGELLVDNILFATSEAKGYEISSVNALIESNTDVADVVYNAEEPVEFYNLQGMKVDVPIKGIYIKKQGNVVKKVYCK